MFDPSKMTILVQAAGGSGDWRMWHYVTTDDGIDDVTAAGFFSGFAPHITPYSVVYVTAPEYVAQLVLLVKDNDVTTRVLCHVGIDADTSEAPHVQGVPGQFVEAVPAPMPVSPEPAYVVEPISAAPTEQPPAQLHES